MTLSPVLLAVALAAAIGQGIKMVMLVLTRQPISWRDFVTTGGMPSSHSAGMVALSTSVLLTEGASNLFVACLVLTIIVIRDALGVRRTAGEEGTLLTQITRKLKMKTQPLHYALGHTPSQVAVGVLIGFVCGFIVLA
jgi:acid phosphatase family membrane protein YuiD